MIVNTVFPTKVVVSPAQMTVAEGAEMVVGKIGVLKESTSRVVEKFGKEKGTELQSGVDELNNMSSKIQTVAGPLAATASRVLRS